MFNATRELTGLTADQFSELHVIDQVDFFRWITRQCSLCDVWLKTEADSVTVTHLNVLDLFSPLELAKPNRRQLQPTASSSRHGPIGSYDLTKEFVKEKIIEAITFDRLEDLCDDFAMNCLWI